MNVESSGMTQIDCRPNELPGPRPRNRPESASGSRTLRGSVAGIRCRYFSSTSWKRRAMSSMHAKLPTLSWSH
eukprot:12517292-Heterocapsa_arctica.AAC.1